MKNFFSKWYATPIGRVSRRFVVAGLSSVVGYFLASGQLVLTPEGLIDSVLAFSAADGIFAIKLFLGSGILAAVDKMRREGTWKWFQEENKGVSDDAAAPVDKTGSEA